MNLNLYQTQIVPHDQHHCTFHWKAFAFPYDEALHWHLWVDSLPKNYIFEYQILIVLCSKNNISVGVFVTSTASLGV
jgi:hypothetical protein